MTSAAVVRKEHRYRPRGTQAKLFECVDPEVVLAGPAGTGKSRACLENMHLWAMTVPRFRGLFVRKTMKSLTSTGIQTFKDFVIPEARAAGVVTTYGGSSFESPGFKYPGIGSSIAFAGMDDSDKIMSSEYDKIYVQEANELTVQEWEKLTTRLRNGRIRHMQIIADCNPQEPTHWLKQRADEGKTTMFHTRHEENPRFFEEDMVTVTEEGRDYIRRLDELSGVMFQRYRLGHWAAAEGVIYEEFSPAVHVVDPFPVPDDWRTWWSVDFGYTNPLVVQIWAEDHDGVLYLVRELYQSQTLVEDAARLLLEWDGERVVGGLAFGMRKPDAIICDHDIEDRKTLERYVRMPTRAAHKDVLTGIEAVQMRFRKQRVKLFRGCTYRRDQRLVDAHKPTSTEQELPGYTWFVSPTAAGITVKKEGPVKENDHGCDALRYMVAARDLRGVPRVRVAS